MTAAIRTGPCLALVLFAAASGAAAQQPRTLSLEEALGLAVPASETLGLAQAAVSRARGEQNRAVSGRWPQLSATLGYNRLLRSQFEGFSFGGDDSTSNGDGGDTSQLPFGQKNTYSLGLDFSLPLFSAGRIAGQVQAADAGARAAGLGLTSAGAQVTLEVVQAYYAAVAADMQVRIAEISLEQADTTLRQTEQRRAAGTQPEFDLLRARVARDNARTAVISRRVVRDVAYMTLRRLTGLPSDQPVSLTTTLSDTTLSTVPTLARILSAPPQTDVATRLVVRQAAEALDAQQGLERVARSGAWPQLVVTSQYGRVGYPGNLDPFAPTYYTNWNVSAGLSFPIVTGGRLKGDRGVAEANVRDARLRLRQITELAEVDTRSALAELEAAAAAWAASEGTVEQARRAYQIAELRFNEGLSTQTELLDARQAQAAAESIRLEAARNLGVARVRVALLPALPILTGGLAGTASTSTGTIP